MNKSPRTLKAVSIDDQRVMTIYSKFTKESEMLCESCAFSEPFEKFSECWVDRRIDESLRKMGIGRSIRHCVMYQPVLAFQPPLVGFEDVFNTFRVGIAWKSRLGGNEIVGLLDAKTEKLFGKAQVIDCDSGNIDEMIEKHGSQNHIILRDDSKDLKTVLNRFYGPKLINQPAGITVITMKRL
jgi:hypothetical protein